MKLRYSAGLLFVSSCIAGIGNVSPGVFINIIFKDKSDKVSNSPVIEKLIEALGEHNGLSRQQTAERINAGYINRPENLRSWTKISI